MRFYKLVCCALLVCKALGHTSLFSESCGYPLQTFDAKKYHSSTIKAELPFNVIPGVLNNNSVESGVAFPSRMEVLMQVDRGSIYFVDSSPSMKTKPKSTCFDSRISSDNDVSSWTVSWLNYSSEEAILDVLYSSGKKVSISRLILNKGIRSTISTTGTVTSSPSTSATGKGELVTTSSPITTTTIFSVPFTTSVSNSTIETSTTNNFSVATVSSKVTSTSTTLDITTSVKVTSTENPTDTSTTTVASSILYLTTKDAPVVIGVIISVSLIIIIGCGCYGYAKAVDTVNRVTVHHPA